MSNFEDRLDTIFEAVSNMDNDLINKAKARGKRIKSQIAGANKIPDVILKNAPKPERPLLQALAQNANHEVEKVAMSIATGDEAAQDAKKSSDKAPGVQFNDIHDEITAAINEYFDESYE